MTSWCTPTRQNVQCVRESSIDKLNYAYEDPLLYEYQNFFHTVHSAYWACTNLSYTLSFSNAARMRGENMKTCLFVRECDGRTSPTTNPVKRLGSHSKEIQDCVQGGNWWFILRIIVFWQPDTYYAICDGDCTERIG